jgi:hypothetical protein
MRALLQLRAILWKNLLLKRAYPWSTFAELFLPVLFMLILVFIKGITTGMLRTHTRMSIYTEHPVGRWVIRVYVLCSLRFAEHRLFLWKCTHEVDAICVPDSA